MSGMDLKEKELENDKVPQAVEPEGDSDEQDALNEISYKPTKSITGKVKSSKSRLKKGLNKKLGAVLVGLLVTVIFAVISFILPLFRLEAYMQRINQRAFAAASQAVERRMGYLLEKYMVSYMINLDSCTSQRSLDCRADYTGDGLVKTLFNQWRDVRIEAKLFDTYGIQVVTERGEGGVPQHKLKDRRGQSIDLSRDPEGAFRNIVSDKGSRQTGREIRKFLRSETKWYQVMERKSVRNYLERKHGLRTNCFFACKSRDDAERKTTGAITRFKLKFVEKLISPFSSKWGFAMGCLIEARPNQGACSRSERNKATVDRSSRVGLTDDVLDGIARGEVRSVSEAVAKQVVEKLLGKGAASAVPIAGQIYAAVSLVDLAHGMDEFIRDNGLTKIAADINKAQYIEYYATMRTANDEQKAGALTMEEASVLAAQFRGAEESLVAQAYSGDTPRESNPEYICDNGQPIPESNLVCEEKKVNRRFAVAEFREDPRIDFLFDYALGSYRLIEPIVGPILDGINWVIGGISGAAFDTAMSAARLVPGVGRLESFAKENFEKITNWALAYVFPLPVGEDALGREMYDGLEAGADLVGSEFVQGGYDESGNPYGLGGEPVSDAELAVILEDVNQQLDYEFNSLSLYEKITSLEYEQSVASRFIMNSSSIDSVGSTVASIFKNIANFFSGSSLMAFTTPTTYANVSQGAVNAFGIQRFAYDSTYFDEDPETYTEEYCEQQKEQWEENITYDEFTDFPVNEDINPCLLEMTVIETGSEYFIYE